jgi:myo-inositol 2-dehydrogenase/D-chiro-inositol 1-dehydrogenase
MATFRLGLAGGGRMGRFHMESLRAGGDVRVVSVAEPDPATRTLVEGPGVSVHPAIGAMLDAGGIDGVLVAVPSPMHVGVVREIADRGLPILCEKPCGVTAAMAREALGIAEAAGVVLQIAYWRRFVPSLQALRARIEAGALGGLYHLDAQQWDGEPPAAAFRATSGGIYVDMMVHELDQIRWLSGQDYVEVKALASRVEEEPVAADAECATALFRLSGGTTATATAGRRYPGGDSIRVMAYGTRDAADLLVHRPSDGVDVIPEALRRQAAGFAARVGGAAGTGGATAADAVAALAAAEAATPALMG